MMTIEGRNFVDGKWQDSDEKFSSINPLTDRVLGTFPESSVVEVREAIEAARKASFSWRATSRIERSSYFWKLCELVKRDTEELSTAIVNETGKTFNEARAEVVESLHMAEFVFGCGRQSYGQIVGSELAEKRIHMIRKPKGVVAIVSPFNFPLAIGAFWCAGPALLEGNTVVLKPSEDTPMVAQLAAKLYEEAGFPPGVFNLVHGKEETGDALVKGNVDCVLFTGSADVGQYIQRVCSDSWRKSCACEMGSKSAVIVFDDANINLALDASVASAFKLSGQRCVSSGRILVQRDVFEKFSDLFFTAANKQVPGDPFSSKTNYGPMINDTAVEKVERYNQMVRDDKEAKIISDGGPAFGLGGPKRLLHPFVYQTAWRDVPYLKEEVFGPHVALVPFDDIDDAVRIYNDTDFGLSVGICTADVTKFEHCVQNIDTGIFYWNGGSIAAESHANFGGVKKSGHGFPSAAGNFRNVTNEVSVTYNHGAELQFPQGLQ